MLSTLDNKQHDPHDVLEISPDVVLVARAAADFPTLAPDAAGRDVHVHATDAATPRVDTAFRASDTSGERSSGGRWLRSSAIAFLFALASAFGAAAWERYGGDAQAMIADFSPRSTLASLMPTSIPSWLMPGKAAVAAPADDAAPQAQAAADQTAQPAAAPQAVDNGAPAAAAAPASVDTAQLIQSMARDVASLNQQLSDLKARIAELKAGQEQLGHDMVSRTSEARTAEPRVTEARPVEPRPTKLGAPPRPLGTLVTAPVHRPKPPSYPPAQAAYMPPPPTAAAPVQIAPPPVAAEPDGSPVVRPPMPVR